MGSIFAGTDESPGKNLNLKVSYTNNREWDQLEQCLPALQTDIFKKI